MLAIVKMPHRPMPLRNRMRSSDRRESQVVETPAHTANGAPRAEGVGEGGRRTD
jgi:hypothetical protein